GAFSWTSGEAQGPGSYSVIFRVTDNGTPALSHDQTVVIAVKEVNVPPTLANPGNKSLVWGNQLRIALVASDVDLPANTLTYTISSGAQPGMSLDPATGAFAWTPANTQIGTWTVIFRVS